MDVDTGTLFLGAFLVGLAFTLASTALGMVGGAVHGHGVGSFGHGPGLGGSRVGLPGPVADVLNVPSVVSFLTLFGGTGYLLTRYGTFGLVLVLVTAIAAGLIAAWGMGLVLRRMRQGETFLDSEDYRLPGTVARVATPIGERTLGQIVFTKAGVRRGEAARTVDGRPLARGEEVVIDRFERGVAYVQRWDDYVGTPGPNAAPADGAG